MSHDPTSSRTTTLLLQRIVETVPNPVAVVLAPDWRYIYANAACRALAGGETADIIGRTVNDVFPASIAGGSLARLDQVRATGRPVSLRAFPIVFHDNDPTTWWDLDEYPLPEPDGTVSAVLIIGRDVSAEERARQREAAAAVVLAQQAEQMRLAIGAARMFFWDWDLTTGKIEWSDGLEAACGLPPGAFDGTVEMFRSLLHPDDVARVEAAVARALSSEALYDIEFRMLRANGDPRWVLARGTVLRNAEGAPERFVGIDLDVTAQKQAGADLAAREAGLRIAQETAAFGTWEWDIRGDRRTWSAEQFRLYGLEPSDRGPAFPDWLAMIHEDDRERIVRSRDRTFDWPDGRVSDILRVRRKDDGEVRWLMVLGRVTETAPDGRATRMRGIDIDVTTVMKVHQDLHDTNALLRAISACSPDMIYAKDREGRFLFANPATLAVLGRSESDVIGHALSEVHDNPDEVAAMTATDRLVLETGQNQLREEVFASAQAGPRVFRDHKAPLRAADGRVLGVVGVSADITDLKQSETRLREAIAAGDILVREADHRIKNSLQMVAGLLTLQARRSSDPAVVEALRQARDRVMSIGDTHRTLYRSADLRSVDLAGVLRDLAGHVGDLATGVVVRLEAPKELPMDAERGIPLGLVVNELLTNAVRHGYPNGGGVVTVRLAIESNAIAVVVADDGIGMPDAAAGAAGGLGSTVIRALVEQIGATIAFAGGPGQGTRAMLAVPLRPAAERDGPAGQSS